MKLNVLSAEIYRKKINNSKGYLRKKNISKNARHKKSYNTNNNYLNYL